jgi:hypothetical protein
MDWLRMSAGFDHHPQVLEAGWHGAQLFLLLLRISRRFRLNGRIPSKYLGQAFLKTYWRCPDDFPVEEAKRACVSSGLIRQEVDGIMIDGWERWSGKETSTERVRRFRSSPRVTNVSVTDVTKRRGEESREEESREEEKEASPARAVLEHWAKVREKPAVFDRPDYSVVQKALKLFSCEQLKRAVEGVANDPWSERRSHDSPGQIFGTAAAVRKFIELADKGSPKPVITLDQIRRGNQRAEDQGWGEVEKRPVNRTKVIT